MSDSNAHAFGSPQPSVLIFEYEGIIKVFHDKYDDLIIHEWLEYNPDEKDVIIIEVLQKIDETFLNIGVRKVLVKVDKTRGVFSPEVNKYIKERG